MSPTRREFLERTAALGAAPLAGGMVGLEGSGRRPGPSTLRRPGEATLAFAGDVFLLDGPAGPSRYRKEGYPSDILGSCDLAFANLENGLSTVGSSDLGGFPYGAALRGDPSRARELSAMGFDAVSLANNHTGNFGRDALLETMDVLDAEGVRHAGAGRNRDEAFSGELLEAGGLTVAFHSVYTMYQKYAAPDRAGPETPGIAGCRAYDVVLTGSDPLEVEGMREENDPAYLIPRGAPPSTAVMAPFREELAHLQRAVRRSREEADVVVVSVHFHWGRHLRPDVPAHQRGFAHAAVRAGADLVVGHGAHVLRGMEVYGDRPILYSVGNFLLSPSGEGPSGDPASEEGDQGPVAEDRQGVLLLYRVDGDSWDVSFVPLVIGDDGVPVRASGRTGREILARVEGLSAGFSGSEASFERKAGIR